MIRRLKKLSIIGKSFWLYLLASIIFLTSLIVAVLSNNIRSKYEYTDQQYNFGKVNFFESVVNYYYVNLQTTNIGYKIDKDYYDNYGKNCLTPGTFARIIFIEDGDYSIILRVYDEPGNLVYDIVPYKINTCIVTEIIAYSFMFISLASVYIFAFIINPKALKNIFIDKDTIIWKGNRALIKNKDSFVQKCLNRKKVSNYFGFILLGCSIIVIPLYGLIVHSPDIQYDFNLVNTSLFLFIFASPFFFFSSKVFNKKKAILNFINDYKEYLTTSKDTFPTNDSVKFLNQNLQFGTMVCFTNYPQLAIIFIYNKADKRMNWVLTDSLYEFITKRNILIEGLDYFLSNFEAELKEFNSKTLKNKLLVYYQ